MAKVPAKRFLNISGWALKGVIPKLGEPEASESSLAPPLRDCSALAVSQSGVGRAAFSQEACQGKPVVYPEMVSGQGLNSSESNLFPQISNQLPLKFLFNSISINDYFNVYFYVKYLVLDLVLFPIMLFSHSTTLLKLL